MTTTYFLDNTPIPATAFTGGLRFTLDGLPLEQAIERDIPRFVQRLGCQPSTVVVSAPVGVERVAGLVVEVAEGWLQAKEFELK